MAGSASVEANFGEDAAKPFKYDVKTCPGMVFKWINWIGELSKLGIKQFYIYFSTVPKCFVIYSDPMELDTLDWQYGFYQNTIDHFIHIFACHEW
jgi:hypothetical protein